MTIGDTPPGHHVIGCIHELLPVDDSPESLASLLRHECDRCDGARVLIDLSGLRTFDGRHVDAIIEAIEPGGERWSIALPADADPDFLDRLRRERHRIVERDLI